MPNRTIPRVRGRVFPGIRPTLAALAAALMLVVGLALPAAAAPPASGPPTDDGPTAAAWGAGWLASQLDANVPLQVFGSPDWGSTVEAGLALAQTGVAPGTLAEVWDAVVADRDLVVAPLGSDDPGRLARVVLLATLTGADPRSVGGGAGADLVARLEATIRTDGADAGLYGSADPTYDGAFRQGLAIAALSAAGGTVDPAAPAWLLAQQCADGAWMPYRADTSVPCAIDTDLFVGPDSNSTALGIVGLVRAGAGDAAVEAGLGRLDADQAADGGWGFYAGDPTDPNSTAIVLQAYSTAGRQPGGAATSALLSFQVGCDADPADRGGFASAFSDGAPDVLATVQAVPGAAGQAIPGTAGQPAAPPLDCDPDETTTTTTTTTEPPAPTTSAAPPVVEGTQVVDPGTSVMGSSAVATPASTASAQGASALARTGSDPSGPAALGALLLAAGTVLLLVRRGLRPEGARR